MSVELTASKPYIPIQGMNADSNGITTKSLECIIANNVDIESSEISRRPGTTLLSKEDLKFKMQLTLSGCDNSEMNGEWNRHIFPPPPPLNEFAYYTRFVTTPIAHTYNLELIEDRFVITKNDTLTPDWWIVYWADTNTTIPNNILWMKDNNPRNLKEPVQPDTYPWTRPDDQTPMPNMQFSDAIELPFNDKVIKFFKYIYPELSRPVGDEILQNPDFINDDDWVVGDGWVISNGVAHHDDPTKTEDLSQTIPALDTGTYEMELVITDYVEQGGTESGRIDVVVGGKTFHVAGNGKHYFRFVLPDTTDPFVITPVAFQGGIGGVSLKREIATPQSGMKLFAFCSSRIYRYDFDMGWAIVWEGTLSHDSWSITSFIDKTVGATVVAAGSSYTHPTDTYVDGATRSLLYYDYHLDKFLPLVLEAEKYRTYTEVITVPSQTKRITGTVSEKVLRGDTLFIIEGVGVLGRTYYNTDYNDRGNEVCFITAISDKMIEGRNSYVELETGSFSIEMVDTSLDNETLRIEYTTSEIAIIKPITVINYHNSLVLCNLAESPQGGYQYMPWRIRWTDFNDMKSIRWRDYQDLALSDISPILAVTPLETVSSSTIYGPLYFFKHNCIIRGMFNQNYRQNPKLPVPMFTFEIAYSEGIEAVNTLVAMNGICFFMGRNDVYMFNGTTRTSLTQDRATGNTRVQKFLFNRLNLQIAWRSFAYYDMINRKIILCYPVLGSSEVYPTEALVYDLNLNNWTRWTFPAMSAAIDLDIPGGIRIDDLPGEIDDLSGSIDQLTSESSRAVLCSFPDTIYRFSSSAIVDREGLVNDPIDSYIITRDFLGDTLEELDRYQNVILEAKGGDIEVAYNGDYSIRDNDFNASSILTYGSIYRRNMYNPDVTCANVRFKIKLLDKAVLRWMQVFSKKQDFIGD